MRHLSLGLALLLLGTSAARAIDFRTESAFNLPRGTTLTNELWLQAHTIHFTGTALDDCFLLADTMEQPGSTNPPALRCDGQFLADLWAAGENVVLSGTVSQHARLAAVKTITLAGPVGRNLMALGPTISLATNGTVEGSAVLVGQNILVNGSITGPARIIGTKVTLAGHFNNNVTVTASDIIVMPGTSIAGNLVYYMDGDLVLDSRVTLGGRIIKMDILPETPAPTTTASLLLQLALFCGAMMTGLVFVAIMPGVVAMSMHKLSESGWRCVLFGFIALALIPMAAFFLLFTLVGIPLSILLMSACLILIYLGKIVVGLYVGHLILRRKGPIPPNLLFPVMALGLLVLYLATNLPFPLSMILWFAITLSGVGALVGAILDRRVPVMVSYPPESETKPPTLPGAPPPGAA
jgi:hypothetical protein